MKKAGYSRPRPGRKFAWWIAAIFGILLLCLILFKAGTVFKSPLDEKDFTEMPPRLDLGDQMYTCEDSWLKQNEFGLWEMYLSGSEVELGLKNGVLASELIASQEEVFVERLREMVPSDFYLNFLKQLVVWMNRNLDKHIPLEYQREIYGISMFASDSFSFIGPAYQRILGYHAAHDIGHALQNMNLVACTALGVSGERSVDGSLLVGRNFDFSMGDKFARDKIVAFYRPERGYKFAFITWGGMIGVVSGMNDQGLVVSLNAAKSGIPGSSKTPVSILARQILQYASNIREAYEIAEKSETFVAESFLLSSAADNRTVVLEKTPDGMALFDPGADHLVLTNHFQSPEFRDRELTRKNIAEGASMYRWKRSFELMDSLSSLDQHSMAALLRDQKGLGGKNLGMANEKAINQLIAHHSVIFKPAELRMWVSTSPYQLGTYLCYDLKSVFADTTSVRDRIWEDGESIGPDPFLYSDAYTAFREYLSETKRMKLLIEQGEPGKISDAELAAYLRLNPYFYYPWFIAGERARLKRDWEAATNYYDTALSLEIPRIVDREQVEEALAEIKKE